MSLYYNAAGLLTSTNGSPGSLKSRIFNDRSLKSPAQVYALVSEASRWSFVLKEVIERSCLLQSERKITPTLALLLVHDLLLNKRGIAAPTSHPLKIAITKHKARLGAEFTRARLRRGFPSIETFRQHVTAGEQTDRDHLPVQPSSGPIKVELWPHPRWARINTLRTTLEEQLNTTFSGFQQVENLEDILRAHSGSAPQKMLNIDKHIPNLIAVPAAVDLSKTLAYRKGLIILQDKASCFPAYLLDPQPADGGCLDACAAPGNKTTHLASILRVHDANVIQPKIWACERDKNRAAILQKMIRLAGAEELVSIKAGQDFLKIDPEQEPWCRIGILLLDPSCSGSGIVGRDETPPIYLPESSTNTGAMSKTKKKKRNTTASPVLSIAPTTSTEEMLIKDHTSEEGLKRRLEALSYFQLKIILHAFRFPSAKKITYSTCSVYAEENEFIVSKALSSPPARQRGWRILRQEEQVSGMRAWKIRGNTSGSDIESSMAQGCLRCTPYTEDGTQGFFVAGFVRETRTAASNSSEQSVEDEEWHGLND